VIALAVAIGAAQDKKAAFKQLLNFDPAQYATLSGFYAAYMAFSADNTDASVPVAGVLELITTLLDKGHTMPWHLAAEASIPSPQWVLARFLFPMEVQHGHVCVLREFRQAGMHTAKTLAEYVGRWMVARAFQRVRRNVVPQNSRFAAKFWMQLDLGKEVAEGTRARCPDFDVCPSRASDLLVRALEHAAGALKNFEFEPGDLQPPSMCRGDVEKEARASQHDYGELSSLWLITMPAFIHIIDFACRMLEAPQGVEAEYAFIKSGLPPRPDRVRITPANRNIARLLREGLIEAWLGREIMSKHTAREGSQSLRLDEESMAKRVCSGEV